MQARWLLILMVVAVMVSPAWGDDWPQWLGPQRDSVWRESGIVTEFPEKGLPVLWRAEVGLGYSGPAVADGKVYVTDYLRETGQPTNNPGARDKLTGTERVLCFSAKDGALLWKHEYQQDYALSYPGGPRATPTVADGKVYALGAEGKFLCLDADDGEVLWSKDLVEDYNTETPIWGFSAHPLVLGDLVYTLAGTKDNVVVAFNKDTGAEVWKALSSKSQGYCPPTLIEHAGVQQLLIWHPESLNSLNPKTGEVYWSFPIEPAYDMSVTAPRKLGNFLFVSGIGHQGVLLELDSDKPGVKEVWKGTPKTALYSCNTTPFLEAGMIYGCDCHTGELIGAKLADGTRVWKTKQPTSPDVRRPGHGTAFIVKHQARYFLFTETGDLVLAKLTAEGYEELDRFHVLEPTNEAFRRPVVWSHPAFANQCLFARNDKELVCVSLAK